ncbi:hypothetical protein, partial [Photobacterium sp. OFAV2-7]|uniref:hypothetical protein n=1 Tax=Photobacterium sp. OFAV2-7 TaxID=2917748 RepID=UPI001EF4DF45
MNKSILYMALATIGATFAVGCSQQPKPQAPQGNIQSSETQEVVINAVKFDVSEQFEFFTWENMPND